MKVTIKVLNWVSLILVSLGALNWAIVGMFNYNLLGAMMLGYRSAGAITLYVFIGLSAMWLIASLILQRGRLSLWNDPEEKKHHTTN